MACTRHAREGELDPVRWDDGLDEAQLAVATHGEGPLVVVAGAGTGKTRALISAWRACSIEA